jgi:GNAT superfamily N-acetyltransferase
MGPAIALATAEDYPDWRPMWDGYCTFYRTTIPEHVTQQTWGRILDPMSPVKALIARDPATGAPWGMCNYIVHANTWTYGPVCYLEDLFTHPHVRGKGVGKALIDRLISMGKSDGWERLYWMTRENNATARRLYDQYVEADDFVRYLVKI